MPGNIGVIVTPHHLRIRLATGCMGGGAGYTNYNE